MTKKVLFFSLMLLYAISLNVQRVLDSSSCSKHTRTDR